MKRETDGLQRVIVFVFIIELLGVIGIILSMVFAAKKKMVLLHKTIKKAAHY